MNQNNRTSPSYAKILMNEQGMFQAITAAGMEKLTHLDNVNYNATIHVVGF